MLTRRHVAANVNQAQTWDVHRITVLLLSRNFCTSFPKETLKSRARARLPSHVIKRRSTNDGNDKGANLPVLQVSLSKVRSEVNFIKVIHFSENRQVRMSRVQCRGLIIKCHLFYAQNKVIY